MPRQAGRGAVMKILIAEDSATIRRLVAARLAADGFDVVRALREDPATRKVPIVMLTAQTSEEDVLGGLGLGVEEYMPKPFSPRELSARVDRKSTRLNSSHSQISYAVFC